MLPADSSAWLLIRVKGPQIGETYESESENESENDFAIISSNVTEVLSLI
jgi:hypothetical protein